MKYKIMQETRFLDPTYLGNLIEAVKGGDEDAYNSLFEEYERLQGRIKNLELQASQLYRICERNAYQSPSANAIYPKRK